MGHPNEEPMEELLWFLLVLYCVSLEAGMNTAGLAVLYLTLVLCAGLGAIADDVPGNHEEVMPTGWVHAPSSKENPELWECAGRGGSWVVSKRHGTIQIKELDIDTQEQAELPLHVKLSKEMIGSRSVQRTVNGWLIGFDAGEFGGGLWWCSADGKLSTKLLPQNVHAIYETPDGIFVLAGLAHLSLNNGEIDQFTDAPEKVSLKFVANLNGSPEASIVGPKGQIVIATPHSVLLFDHNRIREVYKSGEDLIYPTSVVMEGNGEIFVAMRFFVLRLAPDNADYGPDWLMPAKCRAFRTTRNICRCTAPKLKSKSPS